MVLSWPAQSPDTFKLTKRLVQGVFVPLITVIGQPALQLSFRAELVTVNLHHPGNISTQPVNGIELLHTDMHRVLREVLLTPDNAARVLKPNKRLSQLPRIHNNTGIRQPLRQLLLDLAPSVARLK
jgi:hypothetical protein